MKIIFTANRETFTVEEILGEEKYIKFLAEYNGYTVEKMSKEELNIKQKEDKND